LWLAWHYSLTGQIERAAELVKWAEQAADAESNLPEQVNQLLLAPEFYDHWVEIRGPIANPLLWTHAKYLIVTHALQKVPTSQTPKSNVISA
jgi:isomaltose glucohydrolase